ncbi:MAG: hypothetical protein OEN55_16390 [Alphaproteobacteria bacterium]|nr:hypothetical protein [Alphaproteobacteria bacterium]
MTNTGKPMCRAAMRLLAVAVLSAGLAACSGMQPYNFVAVDEIPPGPGLISGEAGEFVLYRR